MKAVLILGLALAVGTLAGDFENELRSRILIFASKCKAEVDATEADIAPVIIHEEPTTQTGKCFLACLKKKFGFLNSAGKIDKDATYAFLKKLKVLMDDDLYQKITKIADTCLNEVKDGDNECETATEMFKCYHREREAHGLSAIDFSE